MDTFSVVVNGVNVRDEITVTDTFWLPFIPPVGSHVRVRNDTVQIKHIDIDPHPVIAGQPLVTVTGWVLDFSRKVSN